MVNYEPYNVDDGKEKSIESEEGNIYAGNYVEGLIKENDKSVNIGFYDDPVRGKDKIASIPISFLKRNVYITGKTGYGKSLLLKSLISQIHFNTDKNYLILDSRSDLSISDKIDELNYIGSDGNYSLGLAEKEIPVFKNIYNEFFEKQGKKDIDFIERMDEEVNSNNYKDLIFETEDYNDFFEQRLTSNERIKKVLEKFRKIDLEVYEIIFGEDTLGEHIFEENFAVNINVDYESKKIFFDFLSKYILLSKKEEDDFTNNFVFLYDILDFISKDTRTELFSKSRWFNIGLITCDQTIKDDIIQNTTRLQKHLN
jgi:hypothetical protein